ncbi:hypothetical protein ACIQUZ_16355 [Streptomyces griseus]|uniref:Uncharacterized protein n=1 Tax=Streptomyces griseus subsp. griseus (strain JCM 4626 / CBS 651.72 / NBRC 13350 / KCC S-0626 / ISP 5235) TaxID=455632 RepID=B1VMX7_STRGG|nr:MULTISPECIES: hypothetical protein [Streptomyces]MYR14964.1 hypothetical protein [Streptomyces sp. SID724]MYR54419.1 hypothetical protein [Streptomyces sp. SID4928]MYT81974.1 hypothetical protein [Streptomyces sp. SID8364]EGE46415.1 hypothetical protein SACT1_7127 [Streptomyces sp. ACT-1]MBW3709367.1 hypothetical protein [Streptomyces griseus]
MSEESESVSAPVSGPEGITPDRLLHTGASDRPSAEDLVLASGRDVTPENLEWARRKLAAEGRSAIDKQLP